MTGPDQTRTRGGALASVAIPTHDSAHCLEACVEAVRACLGECAVVVADNASSDSTAEVAKGLGGDVRVVSMGRNAGFGAAANAGIAACPTENVVLLNPDVRLTFADMKRMEGAAGDAFHGLHAIALGGGRGGARVVLWRERPWWWEALGQVMTPFWPREMSWRPPMLPVGRVWAPAAGIALRRSEFLELGGFDERFFMYGEDRDLSRRYRAAGLPVGGMTAIRGVHGYGGSSAGSPAKSPPRLAWSLLAWIEYVALTAGREQARRAAAVRLRGMAAVTALIARSAKGRPFARADVKLEQMRTVREYVHRWLDRSLPDSDPLAVPSYYPLARDALGSCI